MMNPAKRTPRKRGANYTSRGIIKKRVYESELARLQVELVKLQMWIKHKGLKIVVIFEGRDAADFIRLRVDGIDLALEPEIDQVHDHPVADGELFARSADDRDLLGSE